MDNFALGSIGAGAIWVIVGIVFFIAFISYLYFSLCLYKICKKCGIENAWLAWIPIVQIVPMLQCGGKPLWWILLLFIPLVNIIVGIIVWMAIAERRGKPSWVGILIIVPILGVFIPAYLAFTD
ncbi:MAG TPA: DUF5684 domain-containing protein [Acidobacteriota bacterium]|nr:DUF5684 domain-containing protein [Acidobacteriota bacterium]